MAVARQRATHVHTRLTVTPYCRIHTVVVSTVAFVVLALTNDHVVNGLHVQLHTTVVPWNVLQLIETSRERASSRLAVPTPQLLTKGTMLSYHP